ncbi:flavin reductase family protein [Geofilum sp. OHC36d9]|uniref:flavin reductase family protein n=1 Tax=Geofilum sp. OHC36d9 TaxID=3458413 RepID=UPI0040335E6A
MAKIDWKPGNMIYPLPAVMVSVGTSVDEYNIITVSWTGTTCSNPPMCYISVRPERHSYELLKKAGEFVLNLTTHDLAFATDWCGVRSGRDYNKFGEMKLTPAPASVVNAPIIAESPVNIECRISQIIPLGSHDMFLAEVLNVKVEDEYLDSKTNAFALDRANLICYSHGRYFDIGKPIGKFGFSVQKKKSKKKKRG